MHCTQKRNKELTKEIDKLRQQVQSQKYEIEALQNKLIVKEVLLRASDSSKNDAKDVLDEMKAELERIGKRITKHISRLKDPPLNEVGVPINRAESLESVISVEPKSTSEGSRSEPTIDHGSDQEDTIPMEMSTDRRYRYKRKDSDIESDQASSIRSVKTVINIKQPRWTAKHPMSEHSVEDIPAIKVEQPLGIQPHATRVTQTRDRNDELATQSDTNKSLLFTRPVQVKSPSGSELSDAEVKSRSSRHTKELVTRPLPTQRKQRSELGVLKERSTSTDCKTQDRKPTATQPDEECDFTLKFKKITGKNRP